MRLTHRASQCVRRGCPELFILAGRMSSQADVPSDKVATIQEGVRGVLQAFAEEMHVAGLSRAFIQDAQLPLIALVDEAAGQCPAVREGWRKIQFSVYGHTMLGHRVFERLRELRQDPDTPVELLELYFRCLRWGFQGEYGSGRTRELDALREALYHDIARKRASVASLLPEVGTSSGSTLSTFVLGPGWIVGVVVMALMLVWSGLSWSSHDRLETVRIEVREAADQQIGAARNVQDEFIRKESDGRKRSP